jgi:hypothetical protein
MGMVIVAVVLAGTIMMLVSRCMWWATGRSAIWGLAAGLLLGLMAILGVVFFAWLITRHYWRPLDQIH